MTYLTETHKQTMIYWANPITDGFGGYTYTAPVDITGRWEEKQELFLDTEGKEILSRAMVYLSQDVSLGGFLYLGALADLASSIDETHPKNVDGSFEIRQFTKIPDVEGISFERKAIL